jgi:dTDP-4-amino-4,6-dideoxygalactose transaminase
VCTYYGYTFRYIREETGVSRKDFVTALKAEGIGLGEGYVEPLYLQPIYQKRLAFKHGYPFSAPENRESCPNYDRGSCPNTEKLYGEELISTGVVRLPHTMDDMAEIVEAVNKILDCI